MNRKSFYLIGLVAVAIVAVIALAVLKPSPPFAPQDATGAIGAVEKHRQQQIGEEDVILGEELEQAFYDEYLADAAALDGIQSQLASSITLANTEGAELASFRPALQNAEQQLASHIEMLQSRALDDIRSALSSMDVVLQQKIGVGDDVDAASLESFRSELAARMAALENRQRLSSRDIGEFRAQLESFSAQLSNRFVQLQSNDDLQAELASINARLAASDQLDSPFFQNASITLQSMEQQLAAREALDQRFSSVLASRQNLLGQRMAYLGSMSEELATLENVSTELASFIQALESRDQLASRNALASRSDALQSSVIALASRAASLETSALASMESSLAARMLASKQLLAMRDSISLASRNLASRSDQLESRSALESFRSQLASFESQLASRQAGIESQVLANFRAQLSMIDRHLEQRAQLQSRMLAARSSDLGARVIEQRQLSNRAFTQHLANLSKELASQDVLSSRNALASRVQLESRISQLSSRADTLQSRYNQ